MKNKFFSLLLGLAVILFSTAFTSCERVQTNGHVQTELSAVDATVQPALYVAPVQQTELAYVRVADEYVAPVQQTELAYVRVADEVAPANDAVSDAKLLSWQNILSVIFLVLSSFFGLYWKRATNTLKAISDALEDKTVTVAEIKKIVEAWKGN